MSNSPFNTQDSPFNRQEVFGSHEQVTEWVQNIARELNFVIVKHRTKSENGQMYEVKYRCSKGGNYEPQGSGKRKTKTSKTNCPFKLVAKNHRTQNYWILRVKVDRHNHVLLESLHGLPYAMRLKEDGFGLVKELTDYSVQPRNILSTIQGRNPDNVSSVRTIYNAKNKIRRAIVGDRTLIQVLYSHLMHSGYTYYPRVNEHNELDAFSGTKDYGCGYFMWKDEFQKKQFSQASSSTQCSNCVAKDNKIDQLETRNKMLVSQNKLLMTRNKTLEASLKLAKNPEDHVCQSGAMLHELLDDINNLHVQ